MVSDGPAEYLKTTKDYLADTPAVYLPIDPAQLPSLSAEQLLWMHRWIQVLAGYHIDDAAVRQSSSSFWELTPGSKG